MEIISVENIKKRFKKLQVLQDISVKAEKGDVIAVLGPSGGGKSTFLRSLIGLTDIDGGSIMIEGEYLCKDGKYPPPKEKSKILEHMGMVFQHFNLFPHKNVLQNLTLAPLTLKQAPKAELEEMAKELLNKVGLISKINEMPNNLSGGQKQRVAIARALMRKPDILLFDEPTSALDPELTGEVLNVIKELSKENMTMIIVTHEIGFARDAANKIMFMDGGYVIGFDTPEKIIDTPENERIKNFFAKIRN